MHDYTIPLKGCISPINDCTILLKGCTSPLNDCASPLNDCAAVARFSRSAVTLPEAKVRGAVETTFSTFGVPCGLGVRSVSQVPSRSVASARTIAAPASSQTAPEVGSGSAESALGFLELGIFRASRGGLWPSRDLQSHPGDRQSRLKSTQVPARLLAGGVERAMAHSVTRISHETRFFPCRPLLPDPVPCRPYGCADAREGEGSGECRSRPGEPAGWGHHQFRTGG